MTRFRFTITRSWATVALAASLFGAVSSAGTVGGLPLCTVGGDQTSPFGAAFPRSRNLGALVVTWADARTPANITDLHASVLTPGFPGDILPADGPLVAGGPGLQYHGRSAAVGATSGQASATATVVAYDDYVDPGPSRVRVRRMFDGANDWNVRVTTSTSDERYPDIVGDGGTGAWVCWIDQTNPAPRLRVQHLLADGTRALGDAGLPVAIGDDGQVIFRIASDGLGGVYVCWTEYVNGVYAMHLTASGVPAAGWPEAGLHVADVSHELTSPTAVADGLGGLYLLWDDVKPGAVGPSDHARATRLLGDGTVAPGWPAGGQLLVDRAGAFFTTLEDATTDGLGALLATINSDVDGRTFVARIAADGSRPPGWPATGVDVCPSSSQQAYSRVIGQHGGALLVWSDRRSGDFDLYGARFLADGSRVPGWPATGLVLCDEPGNQSEPVLAADAYDGAIFAWLDDRSAPFSGSDIYGGWVNDLGNVSVPDPRELAGPLAIALSGRNPAAGVARFALVLPEEAQVTADVFDAAGRRIARIEDGELTAGRHELSWDPAGTAAAGMHFLRVSTAAGVRTLRFVTLR